jgi:protein N-terminal glutamine amidohydrolase
MEYTACYCEENIYLYVKTCIESHKEIYAVFISNPSKSVLLCRQKAGKGARKFVVWDYHVIALFRDESDEFYVWDFDSTMESPILASEYLQQTFPSDIALREEFLPYFRIIQGQNYLDYFSSDRSHMLESPESQNYSMPPPLYPCIRGSRAESSMTLPIFWTMDPNALTFKIEESSYNYGIQADLGAVMDWISRTAQFKSPKNA